jgi:4-amino-4-deoxy-L-arabinose transferase-like glycosyltransferase
VAFFPWSVFLATLFVELTLRLKRDDPWRAGYLLAACWVGVYVGLFSLAQTQLPSYVTPMYPGLGLIAGAYFSHLTRGTQLSEDWAPRANYWVFIAAGLGYAIALGVVAHLYLPGSGWLAVFGAIPVLGGLAALRLYAKGRRLGSCRVFGAAAVATTVVALGVVLPSLDGRHQRSRELLQAARSHTPAGVEAKLSTYGALEPSWVFYWGRPLAELRPPKDRGAVLQAVKTPGSFVIMPEDRLAELERELPEGVGVLARVPYYMRFHKPPLVLVGRAWSGGAAGAGSGGGVVAPQRSATP